MPRGRAADLSVCQQRGRQDDAALLGIRLYTLLHQIEMHTQQLPACQSLGT